MLNNGKKYKIIYADPPWDYNDKRINAGKNNPHGAGGCAKHYSTMSYKQLTSLPINEITDDDCMLFMWATSPMMKDAIFLIENWGFKYITIPFVWIKKGKDGTFRKDGIGNYTLNNAEFVLLGRKGKYWRDSTKVKQIIFSLKTGHSVKPNEVRTRIVELCGNLPRIELFARNRVDGWDSYGNQLSDTIQRFIT